MRRIRSGLAVSLLISWLAAAGCVWGDIGCPQVPCPEGELCAVEGDCFRPARDTGQPPDAGDAGAAIDAGPTCGNGVVEGDEPCDDGNAIDTDACLAGCVAAQCGDGILRRKTEDCDPPGEDCTADCRRQSLADGSGPEAAAISCRQLRRDHPELPTAGYWVETVGEPVQVLCEMGIDGGGWTHMAHVPTGSALWNAFNQAHGEPGHGAWGLRLDHLIQDDPAGQDIEYLFLVRDTFFGPVVYSPIYSGLRGEAFDPLPVFEVFDEDGFTWRQPGEPAELCEAALWHRAEAWNWAAARGEFGCDGWSGGAGFIIHGSEEAPETAATVWGMEQFGAGGRGASFSAIELFAR